MFCGYLKLRNLLQWYPLRDLPSGLLPSQDHGQAASLHELLVIRVRTVLLIQRKHQPNSDSQVPVMSPRQCSVRWLLPVLHISKQFVLYPRYQLCFVFECREQLYVLQPCLHIVCVEVHMHLVRKVLLFIKWHLR